MATSARALRFSPDTAPDRDDVVCLHLLDFVTGRTETCEAECIEDGEWRAVHTGQVFGYGKREKLLMGWTPLTEQQTSKYAERDR